MADSHPFGRIATFTTSSEHRSAAALTTTTRGFFAVEPGSLHRAFADSRSGHPLPPAGLSVTARSLAAFAGLELGSSSALSRLVCSLDDELWFLGASPGWVASSLLVPLGADPEEAAALTEGEPLHDPADADAAFPGLALLNGTRAPVWRAMLRDVARCYEAADSSTLQWLAVIGEVTPDGVDRLVFATLASLTAVVDFADNGQEVLVASPTAS